MFSFFKKAELRDKKIDNIVARLSQLFGKERTMAAYTELAVEFFSSDGEDDQIEPFEENILARTQELMTLMPKMDLREALHLATADPTECSKIQEGTI